jgi:tetratricopeptide (TPR) repeat protein
MPYGVELNRLASLWAEQPTNTCFAALAEALRKRGALDDAHSVAAAGVAARPEYLPGHIVMARVHCDLQQWDGAQAELQAALALDPGHPVALDARDAIVRELAAALPADLGSDEAAAEAGDEDAGDMVYVDDDTVASSVTDPVLTESLAMLYRGQGHLVQALDVLDALVARTPDNSELAARRDAMRAELEVIRPRPYDASRSGGLAVRRWLSSLATAHAPAAPPESSFDAFYQAPTIPASEAGDLAAFQAWLRELDR